MIVGTKFQLRLMILIFGTKFAQRGYFRSKTEKVKSSVEFCRFKLVYVPAISHINYCDQVNSWKNLWKFGNGPLCRYKSGPFPLLNVAGYWKSSNTEACTQKLSQILANNTDLLGGGLVSEFM